MKYSKDRTERTRTEWLVPTVLLGLMIVFSLLFYFDLNSTTGFGNKTKIGFVTFKKNTIQRKFDSSVVWLNIETNSPLANRDTLRSFERSDAVITLKNGTSIDIDEHSMIYINIDEDIPRIRFEEGSIQIRNIRPDKSNELIVQSGQDRIEIRNGNVKLEKWSNQPLALYVKRGEVTAFHNQEEKTIQANQKATFAQKLSIKDLAFTIQSPIHQKRLISTHAQQSILFSWKNHRPFDSVQLQLSNTRGFKTIRTIDVSHQQELVLSLTEDSYYWQLIGRVNGRKFTSGIQKFLILSDKPIHLFSPSHSARIIYRQQLPAVNFSWQRNDVSQNYFLQIARKHDFSPDSRMIELETSQNRYQTNQLASGLYYWRVITRPKANGIESQSSEIRTLRIIQKNEFSAAKLLNPRNGQIIVFSKDGKKDHLLFNWRAHSEIHSFHIQVSQQKDFRSILFQKKIRHPYLLTSAVQKPGLYFWRVQGMYSKKSTGFSATHSFQITNTLQLPDRPSDIASEQNPDQQPSKQPDKQKIKKKTKSINTPPKAKEKPKKITQKPRKSTPIPIYPVNRKVDLTDGKPIRFAWQKSKHADFYRFRILKSVKNRKKQVFLTRTRHNRYTFRKLSRLSEGVFWWEIQPYRKSKAIGSRQRSKFRIVVHDESLKRLRPGDIQFTSPIKIFRD